MNVCQTCVLFLVFGHFYALGGAMNVTILSEAKKSFQPKRCTSSLCFAVAGSSSLTLQQFSLQKAFVETVGRVVQDSHDIKLAAVQYGFITKPISPLTGDVGLFLKRVSSSTFENDDEIFLGGGIAYCDLQLIGEANRSLIVVGNGRGNIFDPAPDAEIFKRRGGSIFAVTVGNPDLETVGSIVDGDASRILDLQTSRSIEKVVLSLIEGLCAD